MNANDSAPDQSKLLAAYKRLQGNEPNLALIELKEIQAKSPNNSDVAHLLALAHKALDDNYQAKQQFLLSLSINNDQPEVHNNYANLLKADGEYASAEQHYRIALQLAPKYLQARRNLAICLQAQFEYKQAIGEYREALKLSPSDVSTLTGLADSHRAFGELEIAKDLYKKVLELDSGRVNGWHNLGLNYHLEGNIESALECYEKAYLLAPNTPEVCQSLALCSHENGDTKRAIALFESALENSPANLELHERYNEMLWESGADKQIGESYRLAIKRVGSSNALVSAYVSLLFRAGQTQQAKKYLEEARVELDDDHKLLAVLGKIEAELGNYDAAYHALSLSLEKAYSKDVVEQLVKIDIILARYEHAQTLLREAFEHTPNCQLIWALQSLVWRLVGDKRYRWLNNYDAFVQAYELECPDQYESLGKFLDDVSDALEALHMSTHEPLLQTLRNGTQTAPRLLHNPDPVIRLLKSAIRKIVNTYIRDLPEDKAHPFLARKSQHFEFSGSWSVKLRSEGFHINHVHTDGWISSSCYISIPSSMKGDGLLSSPQGKLELEQNDVQGFIKFGESPLQLGEREVIEKIVRPKPGMVVLFPSYFWHGTFPFQSSESDYRLTAPFDILPR